MIQATGIKKSKTISMKILKDVGMVVPNIIGTRYSVHAEAACNNNMYNPFNYRCRNMGLHMLSLKIKEK